MRINKLFLFLFITAYFHHIPNINASYQFKSDSKPVSFQNNAVCNVDTIINSFPLDSDLSKIIGNVDSLLQEPNAKYTLYNLNQTEEIEFLFYPGRKKNHCLYFHVKPLKMINPNVKTAKLDKFVTGSGIHLGCSLNEIKFLYDDNLLAIKQINGNEVLEFLLDLEKHNCFELIERYNLPMYYAKYKFHNNKLIEFEFGFLYP